MTFYSVDLRQPKQAEQIIVEPKRSLQKMMYRAYGKRLLDLILVIGTAPVTVPVIALLAIAVLITGQSPFYVQQRIGLNGKIFLMFKLRTMLPNAEKRLELYLKDNPDARAEWDSKQKLLEDPRVTPIGNWLRKTSLDELPQLINVLNGSMSLVGPRPMMPEQKAQYKGAAYYRLRPGMTGLWQVSDRNDCEFTGRVRFDEIYGRMVSLTTDIRVLAQTVVVVIKGTGV
ncbi:Sugar transferase involved in LPS biosynthesis (colanic, teichoic acid) [Cognatiyoonia koreensis]|uniref:Sugar transferase involved in LPS biosynthesis (Colanic, teichoic acid) n=1 Tax=Cognatiyoonia koreensis TaxID=364200 RepID=A0A1I0RSK0_9RHOB|nr:sugar transferase [Cognatiyoonia koreensis]SEW44238.1 Sugar transferase involved in LPS biosynthesis (colanic, teichoic acid) [Cognatiyoonia koreensis]